MYPNAKKISSDDHEQQHSTLALFCLN